MQYVLFNYVTKIQNINVISFLDHTFLIQATLAKILSFSSLHILVYNGLFQYLSYNTKKTHHFQINFFYYLSYQETRSNTQIIPAIAYQFFVKKIIQISLAFLDHCLFLICASLASIQMLSISSLHILV